MSEKFPKPSIDPNPGDPPITLTVSAAGRSITSDQTDDQVLSLWDSNANEYLQPMPIVSADAESESPTGHIELVCTGEILCADQVPPTKYTTQGYSYTNMSDSEQYDVSDKCPADYPYVGEIHMTVTASVHLIPPGYSRTSITLYWRAPWSLS